MAPPGGFSVERIIMVEIHVKNGAFTNKWDEPFTMPCGHKAFLQISLFKVKPLEQDIERSTA